MSNYHIYQAINADNKVIFTSTVKREMQQFLKQNPTCTVRTISTKTKAYMADGIKTRKEMSA